MPTYRALPDYCLAEIEVGALPENPTNRDLAVAYRDALEAISGANSMRKKCRDLAEP